MGTARWIGGFLGFINAGPLGALAGIALGWLFEKSIEASGKETYNNREYDDGAQQSYRQNMYEGQRNSFLFSLLVLSAYIVRADGKVMHSEMEFIRRFLRQNFGEGAEQQGEEILLRILEQQKKMGPFQFQQLIKDACLQIARNMDYPQRLQLVSFLVMIAKADGIVVAEEITALRNVAASLGITSSDIESIINMGDGSHDLDAAYKVLGIAPTASDDEVKGAYRKMALKHHPDRVATLGEDIRKAAEQKFKEINEAKTAIYKARGL